MSPGSNFITRTPFIAGGTPTHYYSYDCRINIMSGPHTGAHLSGAWEQYKYGDTQDPWVGDATTGGKVWKADQQSAFTDDGTVAIDCVLRTGAIGNRHRKTTIQRVTADFTVIDAAAESAMSVLIYQNGHADPTRFVAKMDWSIGRKSALGMDAGAMNPLVDCEDFVVKEGIPKYLKPAGYQPQVEFRYSGQGAFAVRSYEIEFDTEG